MRHEDWGKRLRETVEQWRAEPFVWGQNDCCMFAARCVDAITGSEWVADLQSCYTDEASARAYIAAEGSIKDSVTRRLGEPVPRLMARRGDVCLVETETGPSLAVCVGASVVGPGVERQYMLPLAGVICAWRVE
jgi:hypothetical protein